MLSFKLNDYLKQYLFIAALALFAVIDANVLEHDKYSDLMQEFENSLKDSELGGSNIIDDSDIIELMRNNHHSSKDSLFDAPRLYIFISSSMSIGLLKSIAKEAVKYDGLLVLRGLIDNSFIKTTKFIHEIGVHLTKSAGKSDIPIIIDPRIFENLDVKSVPTIALVREDNDKLSFDKLTGSVQLSFALETFRDRGNLKDDARALLNLKHVDHASELKLESKTSVISSQGNLEEALK